MKKSPCTNTGGVEVHRITEDVNQHLELEHILQTFCFPPSPRAVDFWLVHLCLCLSLPSFQLIHDDPIPFYADQTASLQVLGGKKRNCHEKDKLSDIWRKDGRGTNPFLIKDLLQPMVLDVRR